MGHDNDLSERERDSPKRTNVPLVLTIVLALAVVVVGSVVVVRAQGFQDSRTGANEAAAMASLREISRAQDLFRQADKDNDSTMNYATSLEELGQVLLIDDSLANGTKQGYEFECHAGPESEYEWFVTADPTEPGRSGDRFFYQDQSGVIYCSTTGPIQGPIQYGQRPPGVMVLSQ